MKSEAALAKRKNRSPDFFFFGHKYSKGEALTGTLFVLPAVILGIVFVLLPIVISLAYAFTDANMLRLDNVSFIGFDNFVRAFQDEKMWKAFGNTMIFVVVVMPLQYGLALGLALLLNSTRHLSAFFRTAFFMPVILSLAVTSMLWMNLLNSQNGLINSLLNSMGFSSLGFLDDPDMAMGCIIFISVWQGAGYQMLIFLSALKNVDPMLYDAAKIDGAGAFGRFLHVTMPSIKPTGVFVLITMLIGAFRICIQPMVMTQGGPLDSTLTLSYYIYQNGIDYRDVGYSSAIALLFTIVIASVSLGLRKVLGDDKNE